MNNFEAANQELREASEQLNEANIRYHAAILARIALAAELRESGAIDGTVS
jgi:hypothetical protein